MASKVLAALAAVVACASLAVTLTRSAPSQGVTSCAQITYDYVVSVAKQNALRIDAYKLLACHKLDANHAVARVQVAVNPVFLPKGVLEQDATLVYHLTKSDWQADVQAVG